jgi:dihydrofolate reductase
MDVIIIAAHDPNRVIGKGNDLPWHFPEDFKHFKRTTDGHAVIMGRKTFESIGKALPNRVNIVLSRSMDCPADKTFMVVDSMAKALNLCLKQNLPKVFIIGGGGVYREALEKQVVDEMVLTLVHEEHDGDTFFPEYSDGWKEQERESFDEFDIVRFTKA